MRPAQALSGLRRWVPGVMIGLWGCATAAPSVARTGPDLRHPDLDAAETNLRDATESLRAADARHNFDTGGHAARAEELLREARQEVEKARAMLDGR